MTETVELKTAAASVDLDASAVDVLLEAGELSLTAAPLMLVADAGAGDETASAVMDALEAPFWLICGVVKVDQDASKMQFERGRGRRSVSIKYALMSFKPDFVRTDSIRRLRLDLAFSVVLYAIISGFALDVELDNEKARRCS